jgi:hypothetical protein
MATNPFNSKLDALRRKLKRAVALAGLAAAAPAVLIWFLAGFAGDWLLEPSRTVRAVFLFGGLAVVLWMFYSRVFAPTRRKFTDDDLAAVVERCWPDLDSRVISSVQLARVDDPERLNMSPVLIAQLRAEAEAQTRQLDFTEAVDPRPGRRGPVIALLVALVPALAAVFLPDQMQMWARRVVFLEDIRRPRQTQLQLIEPTEYAIKKRRGDNLVIAVEAGPAGRTPEFVQVLSAADASAGAISRFAGSVRPLTVLELYGERTFKGVVKNLSDSVELYVRGGDDELGPITVTVVNPIDCTKIELVCTFPPYLGRTGATLKWGERLEVPADTKIVLTGWADKPVAAAEIRLPREGRTAVEFADAAERASPDPATAVFPLAASAIVNRDAAGEHTFRTEFVLRKSTALEFVLTDRDGLTNFHDTKPIRVEIEALPDRAPTAQVRFRGISDMITPTARVPMEILLRDDHGLSGAEIVALLLPTAEELQKDRTAKPTELGRRPLPHGAYGRNRRELKISEVWEIEDLGLRPGRRVEFEVRPKDFKPQTGTLDDRSRKTIEVVTPEQMLSRLLERQIRLRSELEQKIRTQQELIGDLERAIEADKTDAVADETYQGVRKVSLGQQRLADDMARMMEQFSEMAAEMENNRIASPSESARLTEIVRALDQLLEERLNRLPGGLQTMLTVLPDVGPFLNGWDVSPADGKVDRREWQRCRLLLEELDPTHEFPEADLGPGLKDLGSLFNSLDEGGSGALDRAELEKGRAVMKLRATFLWTAAALQRDGLERMRRIRRFLPQSEKFGAVIQELRRVIDRQRDALNSTKKAGDGAARDVFDDK